MTYGGRAVRGRDKAMTPEFTPPFNSRKRAVHLSATGTLHGAFLPFSVNRCLIDLLLSGCGCPHAKRPHDRFTLNPTCDRRFKHAIQLHDERAQSTLRRSSAHRLPSFLLRQQPQQPPFSQPRLSLRPLSSRDPRQVFS